MTFDIGDLLTFANLLTFAEMAEMAEVEKSYNRGTFDKPTFGRLLTFAKMAEVKETITYRKHYRYGTRILLTFRPFDICCSVKNISL